MNHGHSRRSLLALCGAVVVSGCQGLFTGPTGTETTCRPVTGAWPVAGGSPARTSFKDSRSVPEKTAPARSFTEQHTQTGANAPPVIADGVVYTAGAGRIEARSIASGHRQWDYDPAESIECSPVLSCGALVVATLNETVALSISDGTRRWKASIGSHGGAPVAFDGTVFVPSGGTVSALDGATGSTHWRTSTGANGIAVGDRVYAAGGANDTGAVSALTHQGDVWWQTDGLEPVCVAGTR